VEAKQARLRAVRRLGKQRIGIAGICVIGAFTLFASSVGAATPSGTNGLILFTRGGEDVQDIFTMDANGQGVSNLTSENPGNDLQASWSGDGERIAYVQTTGIFVMDHDGQNKTQLTFSTSDSEPAYSPDGRSIAFRGLDGDREIFAMNADGSGRTQLTFNLQSDDDPSFSPDGRRIAFASTRDGDFEIFVMDADGSNQIQLTNNDSIPDYTPSWSPDGQSIVFARGDPGNLVVMNADGQNQVPLTSGAPGETKPVFSPDGQRIAFQRSDAGPPDIFAIDASGGSLTPLANTPESEASPDWQPLNSPAIDVTAGKQKSPKHVTVTVVAQTEDATTTLGGTLSAPKPKPKAGASKKKTVSLEPVSVQLQSGVPATVDIPVAGNGSKLLKKALKAGKRPKGTITASATDDLGATSSDSVDVKYKKKKK
jgi:Tol biopolymer transport system component